MKKRQHFAAKLIQREVRSYLKRLGFYHDGQAISPIKDQN